MQKQSSQKQQSNGETILSKIGLYDANYKENEQLKRQKYQKELEQQIQQNNQIKDEERRKQQIIDQNQSCDYFLPKQKEVKQKMIGQQTQEIKQKQSVLDAYNTRKLDVDQQPWYYERDLVSDKIAKNQQKNQKIQDQVFQDFEQTQKATYEKRFKGMQTKDDDNFIAKMDKEDRIRSQKKKVDLGDTKRQTKVEKQKQLSDNEIAMLQDYINYNEEQYQLKQEKLRKQQEYRKQLDEQVKEKQERDSDLIPEEELKMLGDPNTQVDAPF